MLRTFINTTKCGDNRWEPPLMDEEWYAICQAIFKGFEGVRSVEVQVQECRTAQSGQP